MSKPASEAAKAREEDHGPDGKGGAGDPVAEIIAREHEMAAVKNRTEFLVNPRILLEFCDMGSYRNFDLFETQLAGEAYAEMLDRVAPEFIGQAAIHDLRVEAGGSIGFSSFFETYSGYLRETRERIGLTFRISHGWKKKNGKWLLVHEHFSYPVDAKTGVAQVSVKVP